MLSGVRLTGHEQEVWAHSVPVRGLRIGSSYSADERLCDGNDYGHIIRLATPSPSPVLAMPSDGDRDNEKVRREKFVIIAALCVSCVSVSSKR